MKKSIFILAIILGGLFAFTSCDKTEEVEPGTNPTATIKGKVYANLDATDGDMEYAPVGTKVFFRINAQDLVLNPDPAYAYQTLQYETTVDANGEYSISLPTVDHQAVNVAITGDQFEAEQTIGVNTYMELVFAAATINQEIGRAS